MIVVSELLNFIELYRTPLLFLASALLGAGGAWLMAGIPFREHLLDQPGERSSHDVPTPRGGGVGIMLAFIVAGMTLRIPTTFLFAVILVSSVSFYGDYFRVSAGFRLAVQFFCAVVLLVPASLFVYPFVAEVGGILSPVLVPLAFAAILVFIVGTANFYNFMDGINGIAGVSGVIAFGLLGFSGFSVWEPDTLQHDLSLLGVAIAFACLGFLPFNVPRAKVFMGDVGSVLLGFLFASLVITTARGFGEMICFAAFLFPFYADTLTTMYVRFRDGENLLQPHRRHLYQVLANEGGMDHWKVTALYGFMQLAIGVVALLLFPKGLRLVMIMLALFFIAFVLVSRSFRSRLAGNSGRGRF